MQNDKLAIVGCFLLIAFMVLYAIWDYQTCEEWGPERPYTESCGKDCIHTVYRRSCLRRKEE